MDYQQQKLILKIERMENISDKLDLIKKTSEQTEYYIKNFEKYFINYMVLYNLDYYGAHDNFNLKLYFDSDVFNKFFYYEKLEELKKFYKWSNILLKMYETP